MNARRKILIYISFFSLFVMSCEKEDRDYSLEITGLWQQSEIIKDGNPLALSDCEKNLTLLFEQNGIYRQYSECDSISKRFGTWITTDSEAWIDMTIDQYAGTKNGEPYYYQTPVRFTVMTIDNNTLELRIRLLLGDRKRLVLFTEMSHKEEPDLSPLEIDLMDNTIVSYLFRFKKVANI